MGMTVKHSKDNLGAKVIEAKVADVRGGVSIVASELNVGFVPEGTPISAPDANGKCHVVKVAQMQANATNSATALKVYKGHNFKAGDKVFVSLGGASYAISSIDSSNANYDELTIGTTLGVALTANTSFLVEGATSGASAGAFKYVPFAIVGTGVANNGGDNLITDAVVIGVTKGNKIPSIVSEKLKGISNY